MHRLARNISALHLALKAPHLFKRCGYLCDFVAVVKSYRWPANQTGAEVPSLSCMKDLETSSG